MPKNTLEAYCLFCRSGREAQIGQEIAMRLEGVKALIAVQEKHKCIGGVFQIERRVFLPGYLFLYSNGKQNFSDLKYMDDVYRMLGDEAHELQGSDRAFAEWLYHNDGVIGLSSIRHVGERFEILSGPMLYFMKDIVKIDKHTRSAKVRMDFLGKQTEIWLAFQYHANKL